MEICCGEQLADIDSGVGVPCSGFAEVNRDRSPVGGVEESVRVSRAVTTDLQYSRKLIEPFEPNSNPATNSGFD